MSKEFKKSFGYDKPFTDSSFSNKAKAEFYFNKIDVCPECLGKCKYKCPNCLGNGVCDFCDGKSVGTKKCHWCQGSGICFYCKGQGWEMCSRCGGSGKYQEE